MASDPSHPRDADPTSRESLEQVVRHLEHILPGQAPIQDFVHHNTIHGFQHLPFPEALTEVRRLTGLHGYLPTPAFREFLRQGRISGADLDRALAREPHLAADETLPPPHGQLTRSQVYRALLEYDFPPLTFGQLQWQVETNEALTRLQPDLSPEARERFLAAAGQPGDRAVGDLWEACLKVLGLEANLGHAEELVDLTTEQLQRLLANQGPGPGGEVEGGDTARQLRLHHRIRHEAESILESLLERVGSELTLRGLLQELTGRDLLEEMRPHLLRHLAAHLDQGVAPWPTPGRERGFYDSWRLSVLNDPGLLLEELGQWRHLLTELPEQPVDAVRFCLTRLGLPPERWGGYLERLALELPGWSGMMMWRSLRPGYQGLTPQRVGMMDYLAVRLVLERLFATRRCWGAWRLEPRLETIAWYFHRARAELLVRWMLFNAPIPEYLANRAQRLLQRSGEQPVSPARWEALAKLFWVWRQSPLGRSAQRATPHRTAWPLFRLCQHLGLSGEQLRNGGKLLVEWLFECRDRLDRDRAGHVWLTAYEAHYREQILGALAQNHGRGPWQSRETPPAAQVVFCMDDREEGIRRHLEEHNPAIETLGAAGFFGVPVNWRGLDDREVTPLCPIVVTPANEVREEPLPGSEPLARQRVVRRQRRLGLKELLFRGTHRGVARPALLTALLAPGALLLTGAKLLAPLTVGRLNERWRREADLPVPTGVTLSAPEDGRTATPEEPRLGFTDREQAARVEGFLRTVGLTSGFAPLVVMMGHGSMSQNNPHLAAYDCGACSGRHGGPNARLFAAMANRPAVRALLAERGITIPQGSWFLGAEHDTCDEGITWFDLNLLPEASAAPFQRLREDLEVARTHSAHERCRRLASAPRAPAPLTALAHIAGRARDFSQARPELGHATNACAFIGRRSATRGAFFDRRMYLISYDPTGDPEGKIVENILLAAGPVGAGISLEYYFSTVDNERFGCGTKVVHNLIGNFGVMEGTGSDLRTGLPRQMIEVHEAMRLLVIVEQQPAILTAIAQRQPIIMELVANAWIQLAAKEPESGALHLFRPGVGWEAWTPAQEPLPRVERSAQWYAGHTGPLTPALIAQPPREAPHG